jgi:hypothetical protein
MNDNYLKRLTNLVPRVFWEATSQLRHQLAVKVACVAGGIRGHERMGSLKYRLPKNDTF